VSRDVLVLGAGLAGLACARDLAAAGADVELLEARGRPGGRVEQEVLEDGRVVQLGGELVGSFHTAYLALAAELGLETEPSYVAEPGEMSWDVAGGTGQGAWPPFFSPADVADAERVDAAFLALAASVDPADPWGHPDAAALDATSLAAWLRAQAARPAVLRLHELSALGLAGGSTERLSLLGQLRLVSAAGAEEVYGYERWEGLRLVAGSAALALRIADELDDRLRLDARVVALDVTPVGSRVTLASGEQLRAESVVCALPVGPLRDLAITGVSDARLASLHRQRQALAAKLVAAYPEPVWRAAGASGLSDGEGLVSSTWAQAGNALSMLVAPERLAHFLAAPTRSRRDEVLATLARLFGEPARRPDVLLERAWGVDPLTQGYISQWAPGDVMAVGPLHGTHEPPFYLCGSDHWVAGYMEGAVRTGRAAAAAALGSGVARVTR
jgi:monoamine oxidase